MVTKDDHETDDYDTQDNSVDSFLLKLAGKYNTMINMFHPQSEDVDEDEQEEINKIKHDISKQLKKAYTLIFKAKGLDIKEDDALFMQKTSGIGIHFPLLEKVKELLKMVDGMPPMLAKKMLIIYLNKLIAFVSKLKHQVWIQMEEQVQEEIMRQRKMIHQIQKDFEKHSSLMMSK